MSWSLRLWFGLANLMPIAAVLASQRASTSVGGGVTSSARADGVPEITIPMAMAGAAPVPVPGPGPVPVVVVVSPAIVVLAGTRTLRGTSIGEVNNRGQHSGPVTPVPVSLRLLSGEGGATCGHKVVIPGMLGDFFLLAAA